MRMIRGNLHCCRARCLMGHLLDGFRSKQSALIVFSSTTLVSCWPTTASFDDMACSMCVSSYCSYNMYSSSSPSESLQTRGYTSYTCRDTCDVGGRDGCISFASDVAIIMLMRNSSSSSHHSFCATNSLARTTSCYFCWASSLFANLASILLDSSISTCTHYSSSCCNKVSPSTVCDGSWAAIDTSWTWGSKGKTFSNSLIYLSLFIYICLCSFSY